MSNAGQPPPGARNLIVCCDGTGNIWGNREDTNVVRIVRRCRKDASQLVYYDPGVGTSDAFPEVNAWERGLHRVKTVFGLALGRGVHKNIAEAYEFLVHNYREGDRIYLFGFSRGAFTVRCVAGLVNMFGIVRPCAATMLPLMIRSYFSDPGGKDKKRETFATDVQDHFTDAVGREVWIHFVGVWDTVESVGGFGQQEITSVPSLAGKRFRHVRHAVSEGEYRAAYAPRLYDETDRGDAMPTLKQLWFPGVHSDVGGSYEERGLSDGALAWMLAEAKACDLHEADGIPDLVPNPLAAPHDQALAMPLWALTGLSRRPAPRLEQQHASLQTALAAGKRAHDDQGWLRRSAIVSLLAAVAFYQWAGRVEPGPSSAAELVMLQLRAPWIDAQTLTHYAHGDCGPLMQHGPLTSAVNAVACVFSTHSACTALLLQALLVAAVSLFLCAASVRCIRALRDFRSESERTHDLIGYASQYPLWTVLIGGWLASVSMAQVFHGSTWIWPWLTWIGAIGAAFGLVLLLGFFAFAAVAGRWATRATPGAGTQAAAP